MRINTKLIEEIETKRDILVARPDVLLMARKYADGYMRRLGDAYSFWLEHPDERNTLLRAINAHEYLDSDEKEQVRIVRDAARRGMQNIDIAWDYLCVLAQRSPDKNHPYEKNPIAEILTPELIIEVGKRVEPYWNAVGYRTKSATLNSHSHTPPNPLKIPELMEQACYQITHPPLGIPRHPMENASLTHLLIGAIQPFNDGNKRTARLLQNRILRDARLPPAFIPTSERIPYLNFFFNAAKMMRNNRGEIRGDPIRVMDGSIEEINQFGDYIASRVNASMDILMKRYVKK